MTWSHEIKIFFCFQTRRIFISVRSCGSWSSSLEFNKKFYFQSFFVVLCISRKWKPFRTCLKITMHSISMWDIFQIFTTLCGLKLFRRSNNAWRRKFCRRRVCLRRLHFSRSRISRLFLTLTSFLIISSIFRKCRKCFFNDLLHQYFIFHQ